MKLLYLVLASSFSLCLGGCSEEFVTPDQEPAARTGAAQEAPDPMRHVPQPGDRPYGGPPRY